MDKAFFEYQVPLGIIEENSATTAGTIRIMDTLIQNIPHGEGGTWPVVCYGDGMSVERMIGAQRARLQAEQSPHNLGYDLIPCPQEFHRRGHLYQVRKFTWS